MKRLNPVDGRFWKELGFFALKNLSVKIPKSLSRLCLRKNCCSFSVESPRLRTCASPLQDAADTVEMNSKKTTSTDILQEVTRSMATELKTMKDVRVVW